MEHFINQPLFFSLIVPPFKNTVTTVPLLIRSGPHKAILEPYLQLWGLRASEVSYGMITPVSHWTWLDYPWGGVKMEIIIRAVLSDPPLNMARPCALHMPSPPPCQKQLCEFYTSRDRMLGCDKSMPVHVLSYCKSKLPWWNHGCSTTMGQCLERGLLSVLFSPGHADVLKFYWPQPHDFHHTLCKEPAFTRLLLHL